MSMISDCPTTRRAFLRLLPGALAFAALGPLMFSGETLRAMSASESMPSDLGQVADPVIQRTFDLGAF